MVQGGERLAVQREKRGGEGLSAGRKRSLLSLYTGGKGKRRELEEGISTPH